MISSGIVFWFCAWLFCTVMSFVSFASFIKAVTHKVDLHRYLISVWFWCISGLVCQAILKHLMSAI